MSDEPLKLEFADPGSASVNVETTKELLTFEYVWENFVTQLNNARASLEEKNTEINDQMNTIDTY